MARLIGKSIVVTLPADDIARLENLVGAGAYETMDQIVDEAVRYWLTERKPEIRIASAPTEPGFVLAAHIKDILAKPFASPYAPDAKSADV